MGKIAYGQHLAEALHAGRAQTFVTRPIHQKSGIAITEVRRDVPQNDYTSPVPQEDAFLVTLNVRNWPKRILWIDDKPVSAAPLSAGTSNIFDLRRKYIGYGASAFHMISFYVPRHVLDRIAELEEWQRTDELAHDPCNGIEDAVIRELGLSLLPALQRPEEANVLFVDHITAAIAVHVLQVYGTTAGSKKVAALRLSEWQETRVKEIISADLTGNLSVVDLAAACAMSPSVFAAAFANTVGMAPHLWLLKHRVEKAMGLLRQTRASLDQIAQQCGFHDKRHLIRVFTKMIGTKPQDWRAIILS
jgi:AraC family transcriptional regulator